MQTNRCQAPAVLVVEDNATTSESLELFLRSAGYAVTCALDGRKGLALALTGDFDLILLDLMLPDMNGFAICEALRRESDVPIVMLTARSSEEDVVRGLETGADDYVCKPFSSRVLLARVRRCLERTRAESSTRPLEIGELRLDPEAREVVAAGTSVSLTRSEYEILHTLMRQPGRVFTRDQLIAQALGSDFDGTDRTIDTHVWSLRRKLGEPKGRPRYILSEVGVGYRFNDMDA